MSLASWVRERWAAYKAWNAKRYELPHYTAIVEGDLIHITKPDGSTDSTDIAYLKKVLAATNDGGPWSYDVWFVLEGSKNEIEFPLETRGLDDVLNLLRQLPGFELRGMNSTGNACLSVGLIHRGRNSRLE